LRLQFRGTSALSAFLMRFESTRVIVALSARPSFTLPMLDIGAEKRCQWGDCSVIGALAGRSIVATP
jgi:hypothetical protein